MFACCKVQGLYVLPNKIKSNKMDVSVKHDSVCLSDGMKSGLLTL